MLRNSSLAGSRPASRLISPEVESIIMSGRNSPVGPLAPMSPGYMSPFSNKADGPDSGNHFDFDEKMNGNSPGSYGRMESEIGNSDGQKNGLGMGLTEDGGMDLTARLLDLENARKENISERPPQVLITSDDSDLKVDNETLGETKEV